MADFIDFLRDAAKDESLRDMFFEKIKDEKISPSAISKWLKEELKGGYDVAEDYCSRIRDIYKANLSAAVPYVITPKY